MARRAGQARRAQVLSGRRASGGRKGALGPVRGEKRPFRGPYGLCPLGNDRNPSTPHQPYRYGFHVSDGVASRTIRTTTVTRVSITEDAPVLAPQQRRPTLAWWWLVAASVLVLTAVAAALFVSWL